MLFPYKYVPHQMEKMQEFIDFIFYEVWCKARTNVSFSFDLCRDNPELFEVMKSFYYSDKKNAEFFYGHVERIYGYFTHLKPKHRHRLKWWYYSNNDIEHVCSNKSTLQLARYVDIDSRYPDLAKELRAFFMGLYEFEAADMKQKVGDIDEHYKAFVKVNKIRKCPFCGINDMQGQYHSTREAYDHYLPKALYPFNSINFHNLVPACHHCNSSYKTSKDPAYTPKDPARAIVRRKVFYPYAVTPYVINLHVNLQHSDIDNLTPEDISLQFGPLGISEEIDTWKDVYGIEERYKAKLLDGDGKAWFLEVLDEWRWKDESFGMEGRAPDEYLRALNLHATTSPFTGANFLKKAFLEGCDRAGLFT